MTKKVDIQGDGASAADPAVRVRAWRPEDAEAWDAYVREHARATLFHRTAWKRVLEKAFPYRPHYLVAEGEGGIRGVLPLFSCRSIRGSRSLHSLPHSVYGGPLADGPEVERALLDAARRLREEQGARSIGLRNRYPNALDLPAVEGFVTFEKELPESPDEVYRTFPKKAREALNQARKRHKLKGDIEQDLATFYDLFAASYRRHGTPVYAPRFLAAMLEEFGSDATILLVRHEGVAVSGVLSIDYGDAVFPLYSGEADGVRHLKSNNFKYFRLMELAVERGLRRFDFGRSRLDNEGAVQFKLNQGFERTVLPYQIDAPGEGAHAAPSPNRGLYARLRKVWMRLPPGVARRLGPAVVKYFP